MSQVVSYLKRKETMEHYRTVTTKSGRSRLRELNYRACKRRFWCFLPDRYRLWEGSHVGVRHYARIRKAGRDKQAKQERPKSIRSQRRKQTQFADCNLTLFLPDIFLTVSM